MVKKKWKTVGMCASVHSVNYFLYYVIFEDFFLLLKKSIVSRSNHMMIKTINSYFSDIISKRNVENLKKKQKWNCVENILILLNIFFIKHENSVFCLFFFVHFSRNFLNGWIQFIRTHFLLCDSVAQSYNFYLSALKQVRSVDTFLHRWLINGTLLKIM